MDIYVVEGPAGSGKTTSINRVKQDADLVLYSKKREDIRDYHGAAGLIDITYRDMTRTAYIMTAGNERVITDRWILSSLVYDAIRKEAKFPTQQQFHHIIMSWVSIIHGLNNVLYARGRFPLRPITIHWMINLPDTQEIHNRRMSTNKGYPFELTDETHYYRRLKHYLGDFLNEYSQSKTKLINFDLQDISYGDWVW